MNAVAGAFSERRVPVMGLVVAGVVIALALVNVPARFDGSYYGENLQRDEDIPSVLVSGHRRARRRFPRHARARDSGSRLCVVPLGSDRRPDHARPHGPPVRGARVGAMGITGLRRPPQCARPTAPGGCARAVRDRADRPPHERRRRRVPSRPRNRPLRPRARGAGLAAPHQTFRARGPGHTCRASARASARRCTLRRSTRSRWRCRRTQTDPPPVSVFPVQEAPSIVRAEDASAPLVVSGDGEGLVDLAEPRRAW